MRRVERENLAHLLATIHLVIRQQDGHEQGTGHYCHLTNFTYEKFVEKYAAFTSVTLSHIYVVCY